MPANLPAYIDVPKYFLHISNHIILENKLDALLHNKPWSLSNQIIDTLLNYPQLKQLMKKIFSDIKADEFHKPPVKHAKYAIETLLSWELYRNLDSNSQKTSDAIESCIKVFRMQGEERCKILHQMANLNEAVNWKAVQHSNTKVSSTEMVFIPMSQLSQFMGTSMTQYMQGYDSPTIRQFMVCHTLFCISLDYIVLHANEIAYWVRHKHHTFPDGTQNIADKIEQAVKDFLTKVMNPVEMTIVNAIKYKKAIQLLAEAIQNNERKKRTEKIVEPFQVIAALLAYITHFQKAESIISTYNTSPQWAANEISLVPLYLINQFIQNNILLEKIEYLFEQLEAHNLDPTSAKQVITQTLEEKLTQATLTNDINQFSELEEALKAASATLPGQSHTYHAFWSNPAAQGNSAEPSNTPTRRLG